MAEVHVVGEIAQVNHLNDCERVFCSWSLKIGGGWQLVEGAASGQTHTVQGSISMPPRLAHPVDMHLLTRSVQGWPKIEIQLWRRDSANRAQSMGYGFCHVPTFPGQHEIDCHIWRPLGNAEQELKRWLLGHSVQLIDQNAISGHYDRRTLSTVTVGTVKLFMCLILRNFDKFDIEY